MSKYYSISGNLVYPIDLTKAKKQLRIDDLVDYENDRITEIIAEAFSLAESYLGRVLIEQDIVIEGSCFDPEVESEFSPISAITTIEYKDDNGVDQTLADTKYELYARNAYDNYLHFEEDLPSLLDDARAVKITGKVGYTTGAIPKGILSGVYLLISYLFENRNDGMDEKIRASQNILRRFKNW